MLPLLAPVKITPLTILQCDLSDSTNSAAFMHAVDVSLPSDGDVLYMGDELDFSLMMLIMFFIKATA